MALVATSRKAGRYMVGVSGGLVILRMAGITLRRESLELSRCSTFVARLAVDCCVRTDQRKTILVIADSRDRNVPALYGVTRLAMCTELPAMNVRMAIRAFLSDVCENELHRALRAQHFFVHSAQWIVGFIVAKFRNTANRLPTERRVAIFARDSECAMGIARSLLLPRTARRLAKRLKRDKA